MAEGQSGEFEICGRCKQLVPAESKRCPRCGSPMMRMNRLPIFIGIAGLLALLFVVYIMVRVIKEDDLENTPTQTQGAPQTP